MLPNDGGASLGLLEVIGFGPAIAAADVMVKAAPVRLYRHQLSGDGLVAVIVGGDVAAVAHAVDVGSEVAERHRALVSRTVIGRPFPEIIASFMLSDDTLDGSELAKAL